jgi:hypothetical protein
MTQCTTERIFCKRLGRREVVADFTGGQLSSDGGVLLLGKTEERVGVVRRFAQLFTDHRDPSRVEHSVEELVRQRVHGLALGFEDLVDHDELSRDPLLASVVGKVDPTGQRRARPSDQGRPLAGKSTLNRLELTEAEATEANRYKKIVLDVERAERFFAEEFLRAQTEEPDELVLDFDATDDPLHGEQEGRYFSGYYKEYVYLPLYVFCGHHLVVAKLRGGDVDAPEGTPDILAWLVPLIRERFPKVRIVVRADSGFARDDIMTWCETHGVGYVFGLAKTSRLVDELADEMAAAKARFERTGRRARVFKDFVFRTRTSWSRARRVVGKAEHSGKGANPRFVVTSESRRGCRGWSAQRLYEERYCARGDMENRIKEQQLYLFADRTSTSKLRSNQIRLWFSSLAYTLMHALRRLALGGTELAHAQCSTIRLKLLKIGAAVRVTTRKVWVYLATSYPFQSLFRRVWARLDALPKAVDGAAMRC